jgi:predicted membrane-bound spermidine synthase
MKKSAAFFISASCGFLSLALEIEWIRYVSLALQGLPHAFSFTLGAYLFGIAGGAAIGKIISKRAKNIPAIIAFILAISALADLVLVFFLPATASTFLPATFKDPISIIGFFGSTGLLIVITAALKAIVFPLVHHVASNAIVGKVGQSMSHIYFANVMGATLGPLVVGFWALEFFGLQNAILIEAFLTGALALFAWLASDGWREKQFMTSTVSLGVCFASILLIAWIPERVTFSAAKGSIPKDHSIVSIIENRHGVIYTSRQNGNTSVQEDITFGMGAYDGKTNTDLRKNTNIISRAYVLASLRPKAKRILVVGLSSGAWTRVLQGFPEVEVIDVVEINAGYPKLIAQYPHLKPILSDSRVRFHFDDARHWLKTNRAEPYDLIVMNTTFHYRAYTSFLLSIDFMQLVKSFLAPQGIVAWNTTGSVDSLFTASKVFPEVRSYITLGVAGDVGFSQNIEAHRETFYRIAQADFTLKKGELTSEVAITQMLRQPFLTLAEVEKAVGRQGQLISIDNMITEYRYGVVSFHKPLVETTR